VASILVVDDQEIISLTIALDLKHKGHQVEVANSGEMAIDLMSTFVPDILITDIKMDGIDGLELLKRTKQIYPSTTVIIMSGFATINTAIASIKNGAYDYLTKPFSPGQLDHLIYRIEECQRLKAENAKLKKQFNCLSEPSEIITQNIRMQRILDTTKKVAATNSTVLITGESGTGKSLLAKLIHQSSKRANFPFVVVNCATLSENLLESELFGHIRGAFTGAVKDSAGRLQVANGGTIFLDEVGEISPNLQAKLLRLLQDREYEKVGDTKTIKADVRIVAATNKNLELDIKQGHFREDLYFRLNVFDLHMPSLRHRPEDILPLADSLLMRQFLSVGRNPRPLNEIAKRMIQSYPWPGNIRELKNAMERAAILCTSEQVCIEDLPDRIVDSSAVSNLGHLMSLVPQGVTSLEELEKQHIHYILSTTATLEEAADILGIDPSTLWRKRRRYNLD
jgi:NtrC-family two-component system response regulator AlgB